MGKLKITYGIYVGNMCIFPHIFPTFSLSTIGNPAPKRRITVAARLVLRDEMRGEGPQIGGKMGD